MTSMPPTQPPAARLCPSCGTGDARYAAPGRGHAEDCSWPTWIADDPGRPPAAPEGDVSAWAERFLVQCGPCDGGLPMDCACPTEDPRPVIAALLERVRVVEGERDALKQQVLDEWATLVGRMTAAEARAESAESALAELRAGIEVLADEH